MKTENLEIVELTKEEQRQIMGGNGSFYEEDNNYGIDLDLMAGITVGGTAYKPLGTKPASTSTTASSNL